MSFLSRLASVFSTETKASAVGRFFGMLNPGQPVWSDRKADTFAEAAYKLNVVGFQVIQRLARSMARVPICLYQGDEEVEDPNHPVLKRLRNPNPMEKGAAFFEKHYSYYLLTGNSYIEGVPGGDDGVPQELWSLRPSRVQIVPSKDGTVAEYIYKLNGAEHRYKMDPVTMSGQILHVKTFNPLDDWYGMSPAQAAGMSIDTHNESSAWCKSLLQNGASPSGAFVYEPEGTVGAALTESQRADLRQSIDDKMAGGKNAGRPLILDGGLKWEPMGMTPKDMDWLQGRFNSAREIAMAFGTPAQLLGIPGDNTYANYEEARLAYFQETVLPLLELHLDAMNAWLLPSFGEDLVLKIDEDEVPALQPLRKIKWDAVTNASFLTTNEKREALGYDKMPDELADKVLVPSSVVFLDDVGAEAQAKADAIANGTTNQTPGLPGKKPVEDPPKILTLKQ